MAEQSSEVNDRLAGMNLEEEKKEEQPEETKEGHGGGRGRGRQGGAAAQEQPAEALFSFDDLIEGRDQRNVSHRKASQV